MTQRPAHNDFVFSVSGSSISLFDPRPESFEIADIAHALAMQPRFNGNTRTHYSVAQHSVLVSTLVPYDCALAALLHDASEACLGDIVSPVKRVLAPLFAPIEAGVMAAIHERFGLPRELPEAAAAAVHLADMRMLAAEKAQLLDFDAGHWPVLAGIDPAPVAIEPMSIPDAKAYFLARFAELTQPLATRRLARPDCRP